MNSKLIEVISCDPNIFKIYVPLPDNPLKNLNCYVLTTPEKNLIIDTGFNRPECKAALLAGLDELGVDMRKTEIYATHLHSDHTGLIGEVKLPDTKVYMSKTDWDHLKWNAFENGWVSLERSMLEEGFPEEELHKAIGNNPAKNYALKTPLDPVIVEEGQVIEVGPWSLQVVLVPGHTPGNTCLYLKEKKILFCGDHILFDITPNITAWPELQDTLGCYLESLKKIREFDIDLALPAHRMNDMDVYERIEQLLIHHEKRIQNTVDTLKKYPESTAYEVASHLIWSMRGKDWTEFPPHQKWFAVGETRAHLDYLIYRGQGSRNWDEQGKVFRYRLV